LKILVIGATGNSGSRLLALALERSHDVSAFVRNSDKLKAQLGANGIDRLNVVIGDVMDQIALEAAMVGQDVVISAAGNSADGESYLALTQGVIDAASRALGSDGRLWIFGGAAALDVPGTDIMGVDLPKIPAVFKAHRINHQALLRTDLDWSMLCPGPMNPAPGGKAHKGLRISTEVWPFARPRISHLLPRIALSIAFKLKLTQLVITYEDAAQVILDNLVSGGPLSCKRVGVALPIGLTGKKTFKS
jgi:putative NADH-flavin reductase